MRAFLALPLPAELRQTLARKGGAIDGLRAQQPETIHLTIRFLGEIDAPEPIVEAVRPVATATAPFEFTVAGLGAFPRTQRARVVWAGVSDGAEQAAGLALAVERALRPLGFKPEDRPWHAHITLGRFRAPRPLSVERGLETREWGSAPADRLILYRSELTPQGARHEVVEELSLLGGK